MPRPSPSSNSIVVLGAGRGLAAVLRALTGLATRGTVIVSIADEREDGDEDQRRATGASVGDLRRSIEALSGEEGALVRAIRRPLTIERLGRHPLGNLVIASAAAAFDDYGRASIWLGEQLGIEGAVLPATTEPVRWQIEPTDRLSRLRLIGDRLDSPAAAVHAIEQSGCVLLAPGSLYRSVLSTAAVPDVATALSTTPACVIWIANLERDSEDGANLTATDHIQAFRLHGVRVDAVLCDPSATLTFDASELAAEGVEVIPRALRSSRYPGVHDSKRLRSALSELIASYPAGPPAGGPGGPAPRRGAPA